jgi:Zn finger protein HypA/HybF involved in hydrogenase expression
MYICLNCGELFNEPHKVSEIHTELSERPLEIFRVCPKCGEADFESATDCENCGTMIGESQAKYGLCGDCEMKSDVLFRELLSENFTENELHYLSAQYAWDYGGFNQVVEGKI